MAEVIDYRFRMRRALAATWVTLNDVLLEGEYGFEKDTGKVKIGDGVTGWNSLDYFAGSPGLLFSDTEPVDPEPGMDWVDTTSGIRYSYYDDGDSQQWVEFGGAVPVLSGSGGSSSNPSTSTEFFDDFLHVMPTTQPVANEDSFATAPFFVFDAGTYGGPISVNGAPGVLQLSATLTTQSLRRLVFMAGKFVHFGSGEVELEYRVRIPTLATVSENIFVIIGAHTKYGGTVDDSVDLRYNNTDNAGRWRLMTRASGVITFTETTVAPVANDWFVLKLVVNADASLVTAYIDDVQVAQTSSNIPSGVSLMPLAFLNKLAGTATRLLEFDYFRFKQTFTDPR